MKKLIYLIGTVLLGSSSFAQTTVTFKPNAAIGEDVTITEFTGGCIPAGYTVTPALSNDGDGYQFNFSKWTYNAQGCPEGTVRALIRFTQLNTIPSSATILSATLRLRTPTTIPWGWNSYYPGSPYPNSNEGWLYRVTPGYNVPSSPDNWKENTVTWNTQPSVTGSPALIPVTSSQFGLTQDINVTSIVQQIVTESATDAYANNGFLLRIQNEVYYRAQFYASSDFDDPYYWPELIVTYTNCNPGFSFCSSSNNPYNYVFTADDASQLSYKWEVNGIFAGNSPVMNYPFMGTGSNNVCLTVADNVKNTCKRCVSLCISQNKEFQTMALPVTENLSVPAPMVAKGVFLPGDQLPLPTAATHIDPNPAKDGWNVHTTAQDKGMVTITVSDINGKTLATQKADVTPGDNIIYQPASHLASGIYFIEVRGNAISFKKKAVKN